MLPLSMIIRQRRVCPVTFRELVGVEFSPHLEDGVMDEAQSAWAIVPSRPTPSRLATSSDPSSPTKQPKKKVQELQVPHSPSSSDTTSDFQIELESLELVSQPQFAGSMLSRSGRPRSSIDLLRTSITANSISEDLPLDLPPDSSSKTENGVLDNQSIRLDRVFTRTSSTSGRGRRSSGYQQQQQDTAKAVRFVDEVEMNHFSRMRKSVLDDVFYDDEELANFRYSAFMHEAGLCEEDFD